MSSSFNVICRITCPVVSTVLYVMHTGCCGRMRSVVKRVIDSEHYQRAVLAAILVNTLSMGIEYHDQVRL